MISKRWLSLVFAWLCILLPQGHAADPEGHPDQLAFYRMVEGPGEGIKEFSFIPYGSREEIKGFYIEEPVLNLSQIRKVEYDNRCVGAAPTAGIHITFGNFDGKLGIEEKDKFLIRFFGTSRSQISGEKLLRVIKEGRGIFVILPAKTESAYDELDAWIRVANQHCMAKRN